jgi:ribosomal protein L21E
MDNFAIIERFYDVPARMGAPVEYRGRRGSVVGATGNYLKVEFDDNMGSPRLTFHPNTLKWLEDEPMKEGE